MSEHRSPTLSDHSSYLASVTTSIALLSSICHLEHFNSSSFCLHRTQPKKPSSSPASLPSSCYLLSPASQCSMFCHAQNPIKHPFLLRTICSHSYLVAIHLLFL